jgi:hypothetical protein
MVARSPDACNSFNVSEYLIEAAGFILFLTEAAEFIPAERNVRRIILSASNL